MKKIIILLTLLIININVSNAQLNTKHKLSTPLIPSQSFIESPLGIHSYSSGFPSDVKSIMQNSEKDIIFIENIGQIKDTDGKKRPDILFFTRSQGIYIYITNSGITYIFRKTEGSIQESTSTLKDEVEKPKTSYYRLDMEFVGMNKNIKIKKGLAVEQQFNYYTPEYANGISPKGYKRITLENLYDGIDLVYYEREGKMKYDFIVKAGTDFKKIKMKYKSAGNIFLDKDGSLIVTTPFGEIREDKPHTYSRNTGVIIESRYKIIENVVLFNVEEYNKNEDIIIDPYRIWATYYGADSVDGGWSICTDNIGNLYVTGATMDINFPIQTLSGAYNQTTYGGGYTDAFILKFNSSGERLWATYYGGNDYEYGFSAITDSTNNLYVIGRTKSLDFPTQILSGAYNQTIYGGGLDGDAFILKFSSSGERLWATYYGGNDTDHGDEICKDNNDNLYVTGQTKSYDFPLQTLPGAFNQTTYGGGHRDVFILKFTSSGKRLWATYYGGNGDDRAKYIITDNNDNLYVTGETESSDFPTQTLSGAYNQSTQGGGYFDAFLLKFNSIGARLWATYYGGSGIDNAYSMIADNSDNLYVTGETESTDFPLQTMSGAYNQTTFGGFFDVFILKFSSSGKWQWATYYGGSDYEYGKSIITDSTNNLYVTGGTYSSNFPTQTLPGAFNQTNFGGQEDVFILKFNGSCARLWGTYYGGSKQDIVVGICIDNNNNLYVTGGTYSSNFPTQTLPGAFNQTNFGGQIDAFILKFSTTVDIKKISNEIPSQYSLYQNYPNPFNPKTKIKIEVAKLENVKLIVYDILGREVARLVNEKLKPGTYDVEFDGSNYASGVYFYKLIADDFSKTNKMVLLK